jgi:hypothetical protein
MELFGIILLSVGLVLVDIFLWMEIGITNDRLRWLEERLTKLEKDAVKITFTGEPKKVPPCVGHELESQKEEKKSNPKQFDGVKSEEPFVKTRTKRKPTTLSDWEDNYDLGGNQ